ncbi:MAG: PilZ domain-containing protein [Calditrichaceae bacterium]|nr:PilZ domain-containing protein [Calditrichaceae bacterium]MBN2707423.1 PilZ domain-containing protein [Calditrichaceae bacterium]RQV93992.1 MAG: hypothetical protein EH224_11145 [Calditrichota bacterium]
MPDSKERRACKRIVIPDGRVYYKKQKRISFIQKYSGPVPMKDISKSGICFSTNDTLQTGEIVLLEILLPGYDSIRLKGEIRWVNTNLSAGATFTGLQFLPFGVKKHFNSLDSLNKLRSITEQLENQTDLKN